MVGGRRTHMRLPFRSALNNFIQLFPLTREMEEDLGLLVSERIDCDSESESSDDSVQLSPGFEATTPSWLTGPIGSITRDIPHSVNSSYDQARDQMQLPNAAGEFSE
jgi:hypothetical protein